MEVTIHSTGGRKANRLMTEKDRQKYYMVLAAMKRIKIH